ncbi:MAG: helix-turn-helix domain-containing protein [Candidatus Thermoplasmatota archaeon]
MSPKVPVLKAAGHTPACGGSGCQIGDLFRLLGKSHVMGILHLLLKDQPGPHRFVEIQNRLKLSPNTLTERLKELVEAGLLTRTPYNEIPPRVDYEATKKAKELDVVFVALIEWAKRNTLEPVPAPSTAATA